MVEFRLWLQVHLLVYIVHLGDVCACTCAFPALSGGQRTRVPGSVHVFTAKLPALVKLTVSSSLVQVYQQHMKASVAHFSTL